MNQVDRIERKLRQLHAERDKHIRNRNDWEANKLGEEIRRWNHKLKMAKSHYE